MTQNSHPFIFDAPLDPDMACRTLCGIYGGQAGVKALMCAVLAEWERDRDLVRFWIDVYSLIAQRLQGKGEK